MTVTIDITRAEFDSGHHIDLLSSPVRLKDDPVECEAVELSNGAPLGYRFRVKVSVLRGRDPHLAVLLEDSSDGESFSEVDTWNFTERGEVFGTLAATSAFLRVTLTPSGVVAKAVAESFVIVPLWLNLD